MKIHKAYKTELKPNNVQRTFFWRCVGASRYIYNWGLAEWKRQYEAGEKPSRFGLSVQFNALKDELCPWVRELPYDITRSSFENLGNAFINFFRRIKNHEDKAGYPKFKKRGISNSFQIRATKVFNDAVKLTNIGVINIKQKGYIPITADKYGYYATISEKAGHWFISVLVEEEIPDPLPRTGDPLGIDVGIKSLAVFSDGVVYDNPKSLYAGERKLKQLQRELSRRTKGGSNYKKTKLKIARCHKRIGDIRSHTLHQISYDATNGRNNPVIVIENLNVKGMMRNHHLAKAVADASMSELLRKITYKAGWNGVEIYQADRWYASSKTCSNCGSVRSILTLAERIYRCPDCGFEMDRDLNAAINLAALMKAETQPDCLGS